MPALRPLLALAEGRPPRPRKVRAPHPKEIDLHMAVADVLRRFVRTGWQWTHFPAGELRDKRTAAKLKAMGLQPGWPDFLLVDPNGRLHALELKRKGAGLTGDQREFQEWCVAHGVPHSVSRSVDEAMLALAAWGAVRVKMAAGNVGART